MGLIPIDLSELVASGGMNAIQYQYFNQLMNQRTIVLNDEIDGCLVETVILPLKDFEEDDSNAPVTLILNTVGGSVSDGLPLVNIIDNYKKPLNIIVYSYACSMGTIILCAGNNNPNVKKYCYPFTFFLFHCGHLTVSDDANSARDYLDFSEHQDDMIKNYIFSNTDITKEEWDSHNRRQWYFGSEEAKKLGLSDEIIGENTIKITE